MNTFKFVLTSILLAASAVSTGQECSGLAGNWDGTWTETDCFGDPYAGNWTGVIDRSCGFTGGDTFEQVSGTIDPATGVLTASTQSAECGLLSLTGTFQDDSASGIWTYSSGGSGLFSGQRTMMDTDGDGVPDDEDAFPNDPTEWADTDGDGVGDNADAFPNDPTETTDTDGDGFGDNGDAFPNDPTEWLDTDGDGTGNNADLDDDGDGVPDTEDNYPLGQFTDAPPGSFAFSFIEALARAGITAGCGNGKYCPSGSVTRAQMAVFLERGMKGGAYKPPAATGNTFLDVVASDFAASYIEQLFLDGITAGCGNNNYCPGATVTRDQMAVFLLRAKHGSSYSPPPATGVFTDVPLNYWAVHWIEQLAAEGITAGCGAGKYCPTAPVKRDQMAVFLVRTFGL